MLTHFPGKKLDQVTVADVVGLVDRGLPEGKTIEYKRELSLTDDGKDKILATVVAFANTVGGLLIIGMEAKDGMPQRMIPLTGRTADRDLLTLEALIHDRTDSPVRIVLHPVMAEGGPVYLVEVPKSWAGPHAVVFNKWRCCYVRTATGNQPLDFDETRTLAVGADSAIQGVKRFRAERVQRILSNDVGFQIPDASTVLLHLCPLESFNPGFRIPLERIAFGAENRLPVLWGGAPSERPTLNGHLAFLSYADKGVAAYTELYRNGCVEAMMTTPIMTFPNQKTVIASGELAVSLEYGVRDILKIFSVLELNPPFVLMLSLIGLNGLDLAAGRHSLDRAFLPARNDMILLPEIIIDDRTQPSAQLLRPLLNILWNAWGWKFCPLYTADGKIATQSW